MTIAAERAAAPSRARRQRRVPTPEGCVYAALIVVLALVLWLNSPGAFTPDIKPEVYLNPMRRLVYDLSAWHPDPQLGVPSYNAGLAPVTAVMAFVDWVGVSPENSVRLLRLSLYVLGAWGAVRFLRDVAPEAGRAAGVVMAVAFVANPYSVVSGATLAVLLPYSLFPWQLLVLVRAFEQSRGWRWPAAFALTFFAMSGMNVAAVPVLQLVAVPALAWYVRRTRGVPWSIIGRVVLRCALLCIAVSAYWLIPSIAVLTWGQTIAGSSETLEGISAPSSFAEVVRGLGLWPMYGRNVTTGPWQPGFTVYLTNVVVVAGTFAMLAAAALAARVTRHPSRFMGVLLVVGVAIVMVGVHPPGNPSPFGRILKWVFENVPGLVALRTTNKAGAGLAIGLSLLLALGCAAVVVMRPSRSTSAALSGAAAALAVLSAAPAFTGGLYPGVWRIPEYWHQASAELDAGAGASRVWFFPGEVLSHYRWNTEGPDDVTLSFLDEKPSVIRAVLPAATAESTNLLSAVDSLVQEGNVVPGTVSTVARYLGVDEILLRSDQVWENSRGARPGMLREMLDADPGLRLVDAFGQPGENVVSPYVGVDHYSAIELRTEPLRRYTVTQPREVVRTEALFGNVLVVGDAAALPALVAATGLEGSPSFRYVADMSSEQLTDALRSGARLALTDTNRRRGADSHHLTNAFGPVVAADVDPGPGITLSETDAQSVATYTGPVASVTATQFGSPFGVSPVGAPDLAIDGDPATAWTTGAYGSAVGQTLTIKFDGPRDLAVVGVRFRDVQLGQRVSEITLVAGGSRTSSKVPASGVVDVDLDAVNVESMSLTITGVQGGGDNYIELAELDLGVGPTVKAVRVPVSLSSLASELDAEGRRLLAGARFDVLLARALASRADFDDEEAVLRREFDLPVGRDFAVNGTVRQLLNTADESAAPTFDADGCATVAKINGQAVRVRLQEKPPAGQPAEATGCDIIETTAGRHSLREVDGWVVDRLALLDRTDAGSSSPTQMAQPKIVDQSETSLTVRLPPSAEPTWFTSGQSIDDRWVTTLAGERLPSPTTLDGHAAAWLIPPGAERELKMTYEPQRLMGVSRLAAGIGIAICLVFLLRPGLRLDPPRMPGLASMPPWPRTARAATVLACAWFLGGTPGAVIGAVVLVVVLVARPRRALLLSTSASMFALTALAWIFGNRDRLGEVTPALVLDVPLAGWLAFAGLLLLLLGTFPLIPIRPGDANYEELPSVDAVPTAHGTTGEHDS